MTPSGVAVIESLPASSRSFRRPFVRLPTRRTASTGVSAGMPACIPLRLRAELVAAAAEVASSRGSSAASAEALLVWRLRRSSAAPYKGGAGEAVALRCAAGVCRHTGGAGTCLPLCWWPGVLHRRLAVLNSEPAVFPVVCLCGFGGGPVYPACQHQHVEFVTASSTTSETKQRKHY